MTDELHYPALLSDLLGVQKLVEASSTRMLRRHNQFGLDVPPELEKQLRRFIRIRAARNANDPWVAQNDAARSLMENFGEMISVLEGLTLAMEPVFAQPKLHPELAAIRFPTEIELEKLAFIRSRVSTMTSVHVRLQRHLSSLAGEYVYWERSHANTEYWTTVIWSFYQPLAVARDVFFEQPTAAALGRYLTETEATLEREHPLAAEVDGTNVKRDGQAVKRTAELHAELVRDELMLELLDGNR